MSHTARCHTHNTRRTTRHASSRAQNLKPSNHKSGPRYFRHANDTAPVSGLGSNPDPDPSPCLRDRDSPAAHAPNAAKQAQQERRGEESFQCHVEAIRCLVGEDTTRVSGGSPPPTGGQPRTSPGAAKGCQSTCFWSV